MSNSLNSLSWRQIWRQNYYRWDILADFLELSTENRQLIYENPRFPLNLPLRLANKIAKGTLDDPILRQFLPLKEELNTVTGFCGDPIEDASFKKTSKLLQKYDGRVLLVCTGACVMNCRFCFRQNFDYEVENNSFAEELEVISADPTISEVILSGGDPLSLADSTLEKLLGALDQIPHIKRIRFHTRFPIGIPERIDDSFLDMLSKIRAQIWFVVHTNHANELDDDVLVHLKKLQKLGIVLLSQTVLLKGVNDNVKTLKDLFEKLSNNGIAPYYLHQLDKVQGAAHFEVSAKDGKQFIQEIAKQLSGYAVPKFVCEIPGEPGKTIL